MQKNFQTDPNLIAFMFFGNPLWSLRKIQDPPSNIILKYGKWKFPTIVLILLLTIQGLPRSTKKKKKKLRVAHFLLHLPCPLWLVWSLRHGLINFFDAKFLREMLVILNFTMNFKTRREYFFFMRASLFWSSNSDQKMVFNKIDEPDLSANGEMSVPPNARFLTKGG